MSSSSGLPNLRNLAYSILKNLGDEIVSGKEFTELGKCSQCNKEILSLNFEAFTVLSCGHVYHRGCIEKNYLLTQKNKCLFPGCTGRNPRMKIFCIVSFEYFIDS